MLEQDQSFSMQANVTSPGWQTLALQGYLVERRADGVYIAPLIPQLFYGVDGSQLSTWRQYFSSTGPQTILSRAAGGYPKVPKQELWWRKVSDLEVGEKKAAPALEVPWYQEWMDWWNAQQWWEKLGLIAGAVILVAAVSYAAAG